MKNIIFTVFFALILAGFTSFGQSSQFIKQFDTLQNGNVLLTLLAQDSTFVKRYIAINDIDTNNLFNNIITSLPVSDLSNSDYSISDDNLFGENTSALPWDICYNPDLNKYYIYGFRKIMIYNANNGSFETPIEISDFDEIFPDLLETNYSERLLYYNNYLYCTSNEGKLLIINCNSKQIIAEFQTEQISSVYKTNLHLVGSNVYWYYSAYVNQNNNSYIRKFSGTSLIRSLNLPDKLINDWCFDENSYVYLATEDGLFKYSSNLSLLASYTGFIDWVNIEYFNNGPIKRIVARSNENPGTAGLFAFTTSLGYSHQFTTTCDVFFNMKFNTSDNAIHFTGSASHSLSHYGKIKYNSSTNSFYEDIPSLLPCTAPLALEINSTDAWVGEKDNIVKIDQNNQTTNYPVDGFCTSLSVNNNLSFKLFGTISLAGDFFIFNNQMVQSIHETGGIIKGVCQKLNRTYYIVSKGNGNGYVICENRTSRLSILPNVEYFDPVAIFCFSEDEQTDIIVAFESRNGEDETILMFAKIRFNTSEISVLYNLDFPPLGPSKINYVIRHYDERIYFTMFYPNSCGDVPLVYFYYTTPTLLSYKNRLIRSCPDLEYDQNETILYTLDKCNWSLFSYNPDDLSFIIDKDLQINRVNYSPHSLSFNSDADRILISTVKDGDEDKIILLEYDPDSGGLKVTETMNSQGIIVTDLTLGSDDNVYGFSKNYWYKIDEEFNLSQYTLPENLDSYDVHYDRSKNLFYLQSFNNTANEVETFILDASTNTFLSPVVSGNKYLINTVEEHNLSYYNPERAIIVTANYGFVSSSKITCPYTQTMNTPWHWLSFPRLQRTGNNHVEAIPVLENTEPMPNNLLFRSNEDGLYKDILRLNNNWQPLPFTEIKSSKGYKLNIQDQGAFTHTMYGTDLEPNTLVPLYVQQNGNPENWIGYFLTIALEPEDAFVGVWNYLTEIKTQYWTMIKTSTGEWMRPPNVMPLEYGDAVIVKVSQNCTLCWNMVAEPAEEQEERAKTEYFSYVEYGDYIPWYIQMDSLQGVQEIALLAGDSCIGASVALPGDTLVEVNAYSQAVPPGTAIEIATWDGLKSTARNKRDFKVSNIRTGARESRKVFTGEGLPYYHITFGNAENSGGQTSTVQAHILSISPNPCTGYTSIGFTVERDAIVEIRITGINGKPLASLVNGYYPEGAYQCVWQPGNEVGNGIYLVQLIVNGSLIQYEKVVVIR
jgi:hypothetical protein